MGLASIHARPANEEQYEMFVASFPASLCSQVLRWLLFCKRVVQQISCRCALFNNCESWVLSYTLVCISGSLREKERERGGGESERERDLYVYVHCSDSRTPISYGDWMYRGNYAQYRITEMFRERCALEFTAGR